MACPGPPKQQRHLLHPAPARDLEATTSGRAEIQLPVSFPGEEVKAGPADELRAELHGVIHTLPPYFSMAKGTLCRTDGRLLGLSVEPTRP